jgi:predicted DNA binding CopG/RHH family protein
MTATPHRFSREELERGRALTPGQVLRIIESWRALHQPREKHGSTLISLKVADPLLQAFKDKSNLTGIPYQSQIKALMRQWLGQVA